MAMDTRLEGAYEQFDKRLGMIETRLTGLENRVDARFDGLERRIDVAVGGLRGELVQRMDSTASEWRGELGGLRGELVQKIGSLTFQLLASVRWGAGLLLMPENADRR